MAYTYHLPTKLILSDDAGADLAGQVASIPPGRALVVTDPGVVQAGLAAPLVAALQGAGRQPEIYDRVPTNPGIEDVRQAVHRGREVAPAFLVAVGGGSPIDVAKAVGLLLAHGADDWESFQWGRNPVTAGSLPVIAIPTTAGTGSEVTHVAVIGDQASFKKGLVHPALFPRAAILDPQLMLSLPAQLAAATGMDALTHAVEAYLGRRANPTTDLLALASMQTIARCLPAATRHGEDLDVRRAMAQAAAWAGIAMDHAGLGLCHALCGPLSAHGRLHHGLGNALLLPTVLAFNAPAIAPGRWPAMRAALGLDENAGPQALAEWVRAFVAGLGLPVSLRQAGVGNSDFEAMAEEATRMAMIANNVREAAANDCRAVLEAAW